MKSAATPPFFAVLLSLAGCRGDMYHQPAARPLAETEIFADHASARPLVPNTIPRGWLGDSLESTGHGLDGKLAVNLPAPFTRELLLRGQERFDIFCSVCHDRAGTGRGMIVQRGFPPPPSFHLDRLRTAPIGHFFDVITNGYGAMFPYASRVAPRDRWAIATYIRALQLSQDAPADLLTPEDLAKLGPRS